MIIFTRPKSSKPSSWFKSSILRWLGHRGGGHGGLECMLHCWWYAMGKCGFWILEVSATFFWYSQVEALSCLKMCLFFSFVGCVLRASLRWHDSLKACFASLTEPSPTSTMNRVSPNWNNYVMISEIPLTNYLKFEPYHHIMQLLIMHQTIK